MFVSQLSLQRPIVSAFLIALLISFTSSPASSHNITFKTNYLNPGAGPGMILDQSSASPARIFKYVEDDLYATAIRDINSESHYHLFGDGLLMGGDSEGVTFTFGGMSPTLRFDVESVEIVELGSYPTFFTPFSGTTAGTPLQVTSTGIINFDPSAWTGLSSFTATFLTPRPEGLDARLVMTDLDVHPSSVPEPSTIALFGTGLAGLWFLRKKKVCETSNSQNT